MADRFLCRFCGQACEVGASTLLSVRTWKSDCAILYKSPKTLAWAVFDARDFLERNIAGAFGQEAPTDSTGLDHHMHIVHRKCFTFVIDYIDSSREQLPGNAASRCSQIVTTLGEILAALPKATKNLFNMLVLEPQTTESRVQLETRRQIPWAPVTASMLNSSWDVLGSDWHLEEPDTVPQADSALRVTTRQKNAATIEASSKKFEFIGSSGKMVTINEDCMRNVLLRLPVEDQVTMRMFTQARTVLDDGLTLPESVEALQADFRYPDLRLDEVVAMCGKERFALGKKAQWLGPKGLFSQFASMNSARKVLSACADEILLQYDIVQYFKAVPTRAPHSQHDLNRQALSDCIRLKRVCFTSLAVTSSINPAIIHCLSNAGIHTPIEEYWPGCPCFEAANDELEEQQWPIDTLKLTSVARLPHGIREVKSIIFYSLYSNASSSLVGTPTHKDYSSDEERDTEDDATQPQGNRRFSGRPGDLRAYVVGIEFVLNNGERVKLGYCRSVWRKYALSPSGKSEEPFIEHGHIKPRQATLEPGYVFHGLTFNIVGEGKIGGIIVTASNGENLRYQDIEVNHSPFDSSWGRSWSHAFDDCLWRLEWLNSRGFNVGEGQETWIFPQQAALAFSSIHTTDGRIVSLEMYEAASPELRGWQTQDVPFSASMPAALLASRPVSRALAALPEVTDILPRIPLGLRAIYLTSPTVAWKQLDRPATCIRTLPLNRHAQSRNVRSIQRVEMVPGFHPACWSESKKDQMLFPMDPWLPDTITINMPISPATIQTIKPRLIWRIINEISDEALRWLREDLLGRRSLVRSTIIDGEDCGVGYIAKVAYTSPNGGHGTVEIINRHWDHILPPPSTPLGRAVVPYQRGGAGDTDWSDALISRPQASSGTIELVTKRGDPYYGVCANTTSTASYITNGLIDKSVILGRLGSWPITRAMLKVEAASDEKFNLIWSDY